ncbi:MAG: sel1 repeat family protein [Methylococcales symbiont of Iophon sp. n. MRB-2018]|nr:MAG: sel1 repeat family protein [Methylococcales symbiont of Iophon sp. n. MRB-2018]KAF3979608.1 MAG: sel1 repeat family protein [Methylococcales symbiont of Iophon sp. n. MRB-2018]
MIKLIKYLFISYLLSSGFVVNAQTTEEIQPLAEQGNALKQAQFASLYILGKNGIEVDKRKAAKWMKKAAAQGLVEAQASLAAMYDIGYGVSADRGLSTQWYEKAAAQGHGTSLAVLGKNPAASGSVQFSYKSMRLNASKSIPREYAKRFLKKK